MIQHFRATLRNSIMEQIYHVKSQEDMVLLSYLATEKNIAPLPQSQALR